MAEGPADHVSLADPDQVIDQQAIPDAIQQSTTE